MRKSVKKARNSLVITAKADESDVIELTAPVTIKAQAMDGDKPKGPRRFEMVAYTGGAMKLEGIEHPVVVDLKGMSITKKSRPILMDHKTDRIVGHSDTIEVRDNQLVATGVISGGGEAAKEICASADGGFPWQASIGAKPTNTPKFTFVPEGKTVQANGQTFDGPVLVARRTSLREISFVALGADDNTSARIAAKAAKGNAMDFATWLEAKGFSLDTLTDDSKKYLQGEYDAEMQAADAAKNKGKKKAKEGDDSDNESITAGSITATIDLDDVREQVATEKERIHKIGDLCANKHNDIEAKAIRENWTVEKVELEVLRADRPTSGPYINTGAGEDMTGEIIAAAASRSSGVSEKVAFDGLDDKAKNIAMSKKLRGLGMHQIMAMVAQANGIQLRAGRIDDDAIKALLYADEKSHIAAASGAGFSTISLGNIFENVQNKAMLDSYTAIPTTVGELAYETDTNDFKPYKRYRITGSGALAEVGPAGEIHNVGLQDAAFSNQLKTVAGLLAITRQMLINDEMGALMQGPSIFGRMAAVSREKLVYTALLANTGTFFGTGNANYISGGSSALSLTSLAAAEKLLMEQVDDNGDFIGLMADRILVPPALKVTAENLFNGNNLIASALKLPAATSGSSAAQTAILEPNVNAYKGKYRPVVSPYLGSASPLTGKSDTAWYLLPSPSAGGAVIQIGYLRGQRTPTIERGEVNFNQLGMAMRCYWDLGVALFDYRAGVKSAGA